MISDELRGLWREPRPAEVPGRGWRDGALVAGALGAATLEATLRHDVAWRPVAVLITLWLGVLPLWRRTRPLTVVVGGFGSMILLELVTAVAHPGRQVGLYTGMVALVLVYALPRWGSGRQIVLGSAIILMTYALSAALDIRSVTDLVGGFVVLTTPAALGTAVRWRATAHQRQLDQVRSRERELLARELHDTVAHHVSAIVIRAQAGRVAAASNPTAAVEALEGVEEEGARTLEEMRALVRTLRDRDAGGDLAPLAGIADLERLIRAPGSRLRTDLKLDGDLEGLPPAVDAAVYRIVQESVTNAMRHAVDATEIAVRVVAEARQVRVTVCDDGARTSRRRDGYGLAGLRERAELLGGKLQAGPGAERGWRVEAELPRER